MYRRFLIFFSKLLIRGLRLFGSSGSALPGLIIERLYPNFLPKVLRPVEKQVILITGTNGKTTTTKMLVEALRGAGQRVVTNSTGSNMTRGLIAALIEDMTYLGSLKQTDWFIFEMDEAYAPIFTKKISPRLVAGLNVLRDQLDRYGEIDTTAQFIADAAQKADIFVYNQLDPLLTKVAQKNSGTSVSFGVSSPLMSSVVNEQTIHGADVEAKVKNADVTLLEYSEVDARMWLTVENGTSGHGSRYQFTVPLQGFHNALNATAVMAVLTALGYKDVSRYLKSLEEMEIPFGRGEKLSIWGKSITVALIKNPSGFASNVKTFIKNANPEVVLFVINDKLADGRDVSWLWDVELKGNIPKSSELFTSGIRGYDMAVRLKQDGYQVQCNTSVQDVVQQILGGTATEIVIVPTYTSLFEVRTELGKYGKVPRIW
ncbi:DUF1727 domain-containing protein [Candidatus Saccharibacteria bacterium]|nr:DUF1727 domain-containing protein [Candidatus Saccharibacteria bacterium]